MENLTPQQQLFLASYLDPQSETWGNAYKSALEAKYTEEYAKNMIGQMPKWLSENISDSSLTSKALVNLSDALDGYLDQEGGTKTIQWKATETTLKAMLKEKFASRTELTGANGKELIPDKQSTEKAEQAIQSYLNGS